MVLEFIVKCEYNISREVLFFSLMHKETNCLVCKGEIDLSRTPPANRVDSKYIEKLDRSELLKLAETSQLIGVNPQISKANSDTNIRDKVLKCFSELTIRVCPFVLHLFCAENRGYQNSTSSNGAGDPVLCSEFVAYLDSSIFSNKL